jgi:hypothetical protein
MARTHKSTTQITSARRIARTLGTFTAARYLALRGWSIDAALWILCGRI